MAATQTIIDAIEEATGYVPQRVTKNPTHYLLTYTPAVAVKVLRGAPVAQTIHTHRGQDVMGPMRRRLPMLIADLRAAIEETE